MSDLHERVSHKQTFLQALQEAFVFRKFGSESRWLQGPKYRPQQNLFQLQALRSVPPALVWSVAGGARARLRAAGLQFWLDTRSVNRSDRGQLLLGSGRCVR